jgi:phosphatidylglycerol:prolipoprotein diacylglycerol transferase
MLGPLLINGYGLMLVLAVAAGFLIQRWTAPPTGLTAKTTRDLSFWMLIAGLLGARLFYVLSHWRRYSGRNLWEIADYFGGGLMFQGGLLTAALVALLVMRGRPGGFLRAADALAPALALGQGLGRIGCLLAGCCHGREAPSGFPLALSFPKGGEAPAGVPLYPTQLVECVGLLVLFAFLMRKLGKEPYSEGGVFGVYLLWAGILRFTVDFFRGDDRGPMLMGLSPASLISLCMATLGFALLARAGARRARRAS